MIGYLKGKIKAVSENYVLLDCDGVGYRIELGERNKEMKSGREKEFFIYTHVRENELKLFGFETLDELDLFELLLEVSGVGPKVALSLISNLGPKKIIEAILRKDGGSLKISGVGVKTADKIVLELRDKLKKMGFSVSEEQLGRSLRDKKYMQKLEEAKDALKSLGYSARDIRKVIEQARQNRTASKMSMERLVKYLLTKI